MKEGKKVYISLLLFLIAKINALSLPTNQPNVPFMFQLIALSLNSYLALKFAL